MATRSATFLILACAFVLSGLPVRTDASPSPQPEATLHDHMEGFKAALMTIAKNHRNPAMRDDVLAAIDEYQAHIVAAKAMTPDTIAEMPERERAGAQSDYRARLSRVLGLTADIEQAYLTGDHDAIDTIVKGELFREREAGHDLYKKPE